MVASRGVTPSRFARDMQNSLVFEGDGVSSLNATSSSLTSSMTNAHKSTTHDITIVIGGTMLVRAHRAALCATSAYFRGCLGTGMRESQSGVVELPATA
jgi:hypothetical protein